MRYRPITSPAWVHAQDACLEKCAELQVNYERIALIGIIAGMAVFGAMKISQGEEASPAAIGRFAVTAQTAGNTTTAWIIDTMTGKVRVCTGQLGVSYPCSVVYDAAPR